MTSRSSTLLACLALAFAFAASPRPAAAQADHAGHGGMCAMCASHDHNSASDQMCCAGGDMAGGQQDMQVFHQLLDHRASITRQVTTLPNGIESFTRSTDPQIAALLKTHVAAMTKRLEEGRAIHTHDPLFAEVFRYAKQMKITVHPLDDGVHVVETSDDPYAARLIQEHAGVLNLFLERGMSEMHKDHALPARP